MYKAWVLPECPYCVKAQALLVAKGLPHLLVGVQAGPELENLKEEYGHDTVPIIVKLNETGSEELVGGYTDLALSLGVDPEEGDDDSV